MAEVRTRSQLRQAAVSAREEAQALQYEAVSRRMEVRKAHRLAERRKRQSATVLGLLAQTRTKRYRSTWSDLPWQWPDPELERVLVALDGDS